MTNYQQNNILQTYTVTVCNVNFFITEGSGINTTLKELNTSIYLLDSHIQDPEAYHTKDINHNIASINSMIKTLMDFTREFYNYKKNDFIKQTIETVFYILTKYEELAEFNKLAYKLHNELVDNCHEYLDNNFRYYHNPNDQWGSKYNYNILLKKLKIYKCCQKIKFISSSSSEDKDFKDHELDKFFAENYIEVIRIIVGNSQNLYSDYSTDNSNPTESYNRKDNIYLDLSNPLSDENAKWYFYTYNQLLKLKSRNKM